MNLSCIIVDDEPASREIIETYISDTPSLQLIKSCKNALEASELLNQNDVDLIFLDINMPKLSGMAFYKSLVNPPMVIFTTAYPEYALEGFEVEAIDYLLKPFPFERFLKAVNKVHNLLSNNDAKHNYGHIILKADKKVYRIHIADIWLLECIGDYVKIHFNSEHIIIHDTLQNTLSKLPQNLFLRTHKSYAINLSKLKTIEGNLITINDKQIPIGATYKQDVMKRVNL